MGLGEGCVIPMNLLQGDLGSANGADGRSLRKQPFSLMIPNKDKRAGRNGASARPRSRSPGMLLRPVQGTAAAPTLGPVYCQLLSLRPPLCRDRPTTWGHCNPGNVGLGIIPRQENKIKDEPTAPSAKIIYSTKTSRERAMRRGGGQNAETHPQCPHRQRGNSREGTNAMLLAPGAS